MAVKKLLKLFSLLAVVALMGSGCWDAVDINDRNIVTAVVVDKTDYGYVFYAEIPQITVTSQGGEAGGKPKPSIVKAEGRTYVEARENLDRAMDRPIFLGAVQTVIMTDRIAQYGIEEYVLRLRQISDYRKTVHVVITTEEPMHLLSGKVENAESAGFAVEQTLASLIDTGQLMHVSVMDVLEHLTAPYKHYTLPTVDLIDDQPDFTGLTVFSGGMKTGFIPAADCKSIIYIQADKPKMQYVVPYNDTYATVEVLLEKKSIKPQYDGERASFEMGLKFRAILLYPEKDKPVTDSDMAVIHGTLLATLEKEFAEMFVRSQQEYQYDCYNLYTPFRIAYPEQFKRMNWADEYQKAALHLSVAVDLSQTNLVDYTQ